MALSLRREKKNACNFVLYLKIKSNFQNSTGNREVRHMLYAKEACKYFRNKRLFVLPGKENYKGTAMRKKKKILETLREIIEWRKESF